MIAGLEVSVITDRRCSLTLSGTTAFPGKRAGRGPAGNGRLPGQTTESARTLQLEDQEQALIRGAREGDVACFGELVRRHERTVYSVVARMMRSRDETDDLVQEVFVSAWRAIGSFRGEANFGTWLHRIAVNATLKRLESLKRRDSLSLDDPGLGIGDQLSASGDDGPLESVLTLEQKEAVRRSLDALSERHRMTVVLYYFEQCSCDEIARVMECSVGTVWSRLHYACKKLKGELADLAPAGEAASA